MQHKGLSNILYSVFSAWRKVNLVSSQTIITYLPNPDRSVARNIWVAQPLLFVEAARRNLCKFNFSKMHGNGKTNVPIICITGKEKKTISTHDSKFSNASHQSVYRKYSEWQLQLLAVGVRTADRVCLVHIRPVGGDNGHFRVQSSPEAMVRYHMVDENRVTFWWWIVAIARSGSVISHVV